MDNFENQWINRMNYTVSIPYEVYEKPDRRRDTLSLSPDRMISFQYAGEWNWVGTVYVDGGEQKVIIHQKSKYDDPKEEDINISPKITINKRELIQRIKSVLNSNMG